MIVLDTNVVSELMRPAPDASVAGFVRRHPARDLYTTAVTLAEIRYGIARLPTGRRRELLAAAADDLFTDFAEKVLPFDVPAAAQYADVVVRRERAGRPISGFDAQIAAICRVRRATLATRNVRDFDDTGVDTVDPWP